jgi:hypothetical protein
MRKYSSWLVLFALIFVVVSGGCGGSDSGSDDRLPGEIGNEPVDPAEPDPDEPNPVVPDPAVPDPVVPDPAEPDPVVPDPVVPDPAEPDPTTPTEPIDSSSINGTWTVGSVYYMTPSSPTSEPITPHNTPQVTVSRTASGRIYLSGSGITYNEYQDGCVNVSFTYNGAVKTIPLRGVPESVVAVEDETSNYKERYRYETSNERVIYGTLRVYGEMLGYNYTTFDESFTVLLFK